MRKIIVSMNVTLDGFMAGPNCELDWHFDSWTKEMADSQCEQLSHADTILLGAATYSAMAGYWPAVSAGVCFARDDMPFAEMMNSYAKVVFSKSLISLTWNNTRQIKADLRKEIQMLKQQPGKDIMVYGSGKLVAALVNYGLIDQYVLWMHPVVLGKGKPLFGKVKNKLNMRLTNVKQFKSGVVILYYST